jgi:WhiB family redox-sensing transcriptional regulator
MDAGLEVVLPASDIQRAKAFYEELGWRVKTGHRAEGDFRVVRLMPLDPAAKGPRPDDREWLPRAACRSVDPDLFFPISDTGASLEQAARAKAVCAICPVQFECLMFALRSERLQGIWGGLTERERAQAARTGLRRVLGNQGKQRD